MIKLANKWDIPRLKELFTDYYQEQFPQYTDVPYANIDKIMTLVVSGAGVAIIDEHDGQLRGAIIAIACPNVWDPIDLCLLKYCFMLSPSLEAGCRVVG